MPRVGGIGMTTKGREDTKLRPLRAGKIEHAGDVQALARQLLKKDSLQSRTRNLPKPRLVGCS
jgi:hypothetical protein